MAGGGSGSGSGSGTGAAAAAPADDGCFSIAFQTAFLEYTGATGAHLPVVTKDVDGVQVEWALGAAVQYLASTVKERSNTDGRDDGADAIVGESVMFMLAVSFFAILMMLMLARVVMQWQPLKIWATRAMRRKRHRGRRNRSKYTKVAQHDDDVAADDRTSKAEVSGGEVDHASVVVEMQMNSRAARGPVALKWKLSDDGFSDSDGGGMPAI